MKSWRCLRARDGVNFPTGWRALPLPRSSRERGEGEGRELVTGFSACVPRHAQRFFPPKRGTKEPSFQRPSGLVESQRRKDRSLRSLRPPVQLFVPLVSAGIEQERAEIAEKTGGEELVGLTRGFAKHIPSAGIVTRVHGEQGSRTRAVTSQAEPRRGDRETRETREKKSENTPVRWNPVLCFRVFRVFRGSSRNSIDKGKSPPVRGERLFRCLSFFSANSPP